MAPTESTPTHGDRKTTGSWYTPAHLVEMVIEQTITPEWVQRATTARGRAMITVLDPACGDGRFLEAARGRLHELGTMAELTGVDVDRAALQRVQSVVSSHVEIVHADALDHTWGDRHFDLIIGNPPFLSQLASRTTRGGASRHGGGPYADAAAEFLALSTCLAAADVGRVALVLPQSLLASRDAAPIRADVDRAARHVWSWWSPRRHFDADVLVCAVCVERGRPEISPSATRSAAGSWAHVVARALGIPDLPDDLTIEGTVGDRVHLSANFRDEYYGLVPAVIDAADRHDLPPFVTSGTIDPGRSRWGERPVRFAKRTFAAPRVDVNALDDRMRGWADRKLVPKTLIAAQTTIIEAVSDRDGSWLPGVPVVTAVPSPDVDLVDVDPVDVDMVTAVLTSPVASVAAWWSAAGTGLSATALRLGPALLGGLPWPSGDMAPAVDALRQGDVAGCGVHAAAAFGLARDHPIVSWWTERLP